MTATAIAGITSSQSPSKEISTIANSILLNHRESHDPITYPAASTPRTTGHSQGESDKGKSVSRLQTDMNVWELEVLDNPTIIVSTGEARTPLSCGYTHPSTCGHFLRKSYK
ncbi:hypothetical protein AVEN_88358-1 [Araneus ventricosus]|uniref:Uncharacterized protein n=1 Tax=Araneus ventricosus TaxID=182803 RepID=A0A4Y2UFX5_ARAVE|nr:hypothetical protein AVEN_88358-1 [Araneus ventricosus]